MAAINIREYITDEDGNKKSVIIDIDEFRRINSILSEIDSDAKIFRSRQNEESFPIDECHEIIQRIERIKA